MLSKKMTFSLMSLITLLAFAFVVSSAMAGDFTVKIEGPGQVSYVTSEVGDPLDPIHLIVTSPQALPATLTAEGAGGDSPTNTMTVDAYDEDGFTIATPGVTIADQTRGGLCSENSEKASVSGYDYAWYY